MMDPTVLGQLLDEHGAALELYARQWCATPEDVVQEAFLKLVTQTRMPRNIVPWLFRVVRNCALSAARAERRRRQRELQVASRGTLWFIADPTQALDTVALHEALGFRRIATYPAVGFKLGAWHDVGWWQSRLREAPRNPAPPIPIAAAQQQPEWEAALRAGLPFLR